MGLYVSTSFIGLIVISILLVAVPDLYKSARLAFDKDLAKIPGPWYAPYTRLVLKLKVLGGQRSDYIHGLHQRYGRTVRIAPNEVSLSDIESLRTIHRVGTEYEKSKDFYQTLAPVQNSDDTGGVFIITDTKKAAARRRYFITAGTKKAVAEWESPVVQLVQQAVGNIRRDALAGNADIFKWWTFMATDVLGVIAFGESFNMLENEKKPALINDLETAMFANGVYQEMRWIWHALTWTPIRAIQDFVNINDRLKVSSEQAVVNAKATSKSSVKTLFAKMYPEDGQQPFPDWLISHEAGNIMIAGTDTTAMTLTWVVYEILKNKDVKQKLLKEVDGVSDRPGWSELESLPYLNNVIEETLRLHPSVPGSLPRMVPARGAKHGGFFIPGGTIVGTQAIDFHLDPDTWTEPLKFNPDRWDHVTPEMKEHFVPFGGIARICLGQNIARLELLQATFLFMKQCSDAELAPTMDDKSMELLDYFTTKPRTGRCEITIPRKG